MPNYAAPPAPPTNTMAIVSLVAGILSWVLLPIIGSIVGLITGYMGRKEIRESNGQQTGDGLALAGIIISAANLIVICLISLCAMVVIFGAAISSSNR